MKKLARMTAVLAAAALALAACSADAETSEEPTTGGGGDSLGDVSFLYHTLEFEFMVGIEEGTEEAIAEHSFGNTSILSAQADSDTQIRQFEDALAAGVSGIVFSPNVSAELVGAVEQANDAGVPVVTVDSIVAGGDVAGTVAFDNIGGGAMAANYIAEQIGDSGKVLELTGPQGAFHAELRHEGFIDEMTHNHPNVTIETRDANFSAEESLAITVDVLTDDPDYQAVFVHTDGMLRGVLSALEQVDMTPGEDIIVVGLDGTPEALSHISSGEVAATVSADPIEIGRQGVDMIARVLLGEEGETEVLTPPVLVTSENVDDESLWGNK